MLNVSKIEMSSQKKKKESKIEMSFQKKRKESRIEMSVMSLNENQ